MNILMSNVFEKVIFEGWCDFYGILLEREFDVEVSVLRFFWKIEVLFVVWL